MSRWRKASLRLTTSAVALLALLAPHFAFADPVALRAGERGQGARLVFEWPQAVEHSARLNGNQIHLTFARPAEADVSGLPQRLAGWVSSAARSADGREITLTLKRSVRLTSFASGNRVIVDLVPAAASASAPAPAPAVNTATATSPTPSTAAPAFRAAEVRIGHHDDFDRAVINLATVPVVTREGDSRIMLAAPSGKRLTDAQLTDLRQLPQIADVTQTLANGRVRIAITLKPGATASRFPIPSGIGLDFRGAPAPVAATAAPPPPAPAAAAPPPTPTPAPPRVAVQETPVLPPPVPAPAVPVVPPVADNEQPKPETQVISAAPAEQVSAAPTPIENAAAVDSGLPALEMTIGKGTPIGVFTRGASLFVVVSDKNSPRELIPLVGSTLASSPRVQLLPAQGGRVVRIDMADKPLVPVIAATDTGWKITFGTAPATGTPLAIKDDPDYSLGPRLFIATERPANPVIFVDPVVGDSLTVVPIAVPAQGLPVRFRSTQAEFLPSYQGLVVRPWVDDLNVISTEPGIEISAISGLKLAEQLAADDRAVNPPTPVGQSASMTAPAVPTLPPLLDFAAMGTPDLDNFQKQRVELQQEINTAPDDDAKKEAWLKLARLFFINGMASEAAAIWQDVAKNDAQLAARPEFAMIRAIAGFSSGTTDNIKAALAAVNQPTTDNSLWQAMLAVRERDWVLASERFRPAFDRIWEYPEPYRSRLALAAIDTAVETQDYTQAEMLLGQLTQRYQMENRKPTPAVEYLTGMLDWGREKPDEARAHLGSAAQSWDQLWRVKAELALIDADLKDNRTRPADILKRLEHLRYAWRGDGLEFEILHRLAQQHINTGDFAAAFDDFSQMVGKYPDLAAKANIADEQKAAFTRIFQGDDRDRTQAFSQLAIWDRYPQFRPTEPSVLDDVNQYMAERVAGIDLLDRAADFYVEVLKDAKEPAARAAIGTRIAGLRLLDDKFTEAVKALDDTEPPQASGQPSVLRVDAQDERRQLRARAIFGLGKPDDALALLSNDYSEPATRLRADILWKSRRWPEVAATLDALIGPLPADGKLTDEKAGFILSRATALALAGDRTALRDMRVKFGEAMASMADGNAFQLLVRPEVSGGLPDRATLQGRVAEVDLFQKFLERYRTPGAAPAAAPDAAVAAAPATAPAGH